ncbi:MAG: anhydro-N-acetylmuramic acid kinase [Gammaproteobacteria bacterium]|nr:anhydro-N-acetylmuramic acid kinase [Gammaproteobacteria bacterium]
MSGTSMDAVDAALVRFQNHHLDLRQYRQFPFPARLADSLKAISPSTPVIEIARCDHELGDLFAECAIQLMNAAGIPQSEVAAIGCHGQTVLHCPQPEVRNSLQLGDPSRIAWRTGVRTVADFRRMDMAAGGQGAPLAPALHVWLLGGAGLDRVVLNIGGIANVTIIPSGSDREVTGFDVGPGNTLLDQWIRQHRREVHDRDGTWAAGGRCNGEVLDSMLADPYFPRQLPKSTGKEYFNLDWVARHAARAGVGPEPRDMQATLAELTCRTIAGAIFNYAPSTSEVLVCGGGVHNGYMMGRLRALLGKATVDSTARHGVDPDAVEAVTFAWLAKCRLDGVPGNLPSVTGASHPVILGAIYEPGKVKREK